MICRTYIDTRVLLKTCAGIFMRQKLQKTTSDLTVASLGFRGCPKQLTNLVLDSEKPSNQISISEITLLSQELFISSCPFLIMCQNCKVINIKQIFSLITKLLMVGSIVLKLHNIFRTTTDHSTMKNAHGCHHDRQQRTLSDIPDCTKLRSSLFEFAPGSWSLILWSDSDLKL